MSLFGKPKDPAGMKAAALEKVNRKVNDLRLRDCKASTYEKHRRLLEDHKIETLPVVCKTEEGAYHMILVVDGTQALDNRYPFVMPVEELRKRGYSIAPIAQRPAAAPGAVTKQTSP